MVRCLQRTRGSRGLGTRASSRTPRFSAQLPSHQATSLRPEDVAKESRIARELGAATGLQDAPGFPAAVVPETQSASAYETESSQQTNGNFGMNSPRDGVSPSAVRETDSVSFGKFGESLQNTSLFRPAHVDL